MAVWSLHRSIRPFGFGIPPRARRSPLSKVTRTRSRVVAALPDGRVVSVSYDGTVRVWDPASGETVTIFKVKLGSIYGVAVLGDGRVAFAAHDNTLRVWDLDTTEAVTTPLEGHPVGVFDVATLGDGRVVCIFGGPPASDPIRRREHDPRRPFGHDLGCRGAG